MPTWIKNMRESKTVYENYENIDHGTFSEMQALVCNIVESHNLSPNNKPLALIIMEEGGTGKSYLINAICNVP